MVLHSRLRRILRLAIIFFDKTKSSNLGLSLLTLLIRPLYSRRVNGVCGLCFRFFYVGISRDLYRRLAIISSEVRRSIIVVGIGGLARRPPRRIDRCAAYARKEHRLARCVAAVGDEGWGKGAGGDDSLTMWIIASIGHGGRRRPGRHGATPPAIKHTTIK